jgi:hypothetical protein
VKQKPKDELFNPISLEVNMERSHARLVSVDTDSGGKEFLILAAIYYLNWYLLILLLF